MMEVATHASLYEQLAQRVATLIDGGTFRPGDRIPSVRRLSKDAQVSVTTILEAYRLLEDRGLIEARPQSGYYVRPRALASILEPRPSRPRGGPSNVKVDDLVMRVVRTLGQPGLVQLGAAAPAPELLPTEKLNRSLAGAARRLGARANLYGSNRGLHALRVQVARRAVASGCTLSPDDVLVTCGAQESLHLALRAVCRPGDAVAIESPTYFGVLQLIEILGLRAVEVATHPRHGMDVAALRSVLRDNDIRACVAAPCFANPLGSLMPDAAKEEMVELLGEAEIPLIEDDTFGDLGYAIERPRTAKAWDSRGLVLLCTSFSKTLAPGYRIGWIAAGRYQEIVERLKFVTNVATSTLPQHAVADFLANGGYDRHLRRLRRVHARQTVLMIEAIGHLFPEGTRVTRPEGGFVLWVEIPGVDSLALHERALAEGITLIPGPLFSPKRGYRSFVRLNAAYWSAEVEKALARLGKLAAALR